MNPWTLEATRMVAAPGPGPDRLATALEAAGWRCTPQRQAVYEQVGRSPHHPTADEVFRGVRTTLPRISLATVYKALEALVACGLVAKLTAEDGSARYDARPDRHYHLRCLRSGAVVDLPTPFDPDLVEKIDPDLTRRLRQQGFQVTGYRLEFVGYYHAGADSGTGPASHPIDDADAVREADPG